MSNKIVVIDYGMGNIFSLRKLVERMGYSCDVSSSAKTILSARRIVLPGVGHFGKAMNNLSSNGVADVLNEAVLVKKIPVLGICLGMQLMAGSSEEGAAHGLSWFDARVVRFRIRNPKMFKIPHVGWNTLRLEKSSQLMNGIELSHEFYFVHSYHFQAEKSLDVVSTTPYEYSFVSAVEKENIFGVQFHPEKSHQAGEIIFKNFLKE